MFNSFLMAQNQFDFVAGKFLSMSQAEEDFLRNPMRELTTRFCIRMDGGNICVFEGYRVRHNTALGPAKGGLRCHSEEDLDTVRALAMWMSWKCSLVGLPLGGGKGGIKVDLRKFSLIEQERISRGYMRAFGHDLGSRLDIPAPDINTNSQVMGWMMDEFESMTGCHETGVITGKPLELGGSEGRIDSTSRGGVFILEEFSKVYGLDFRGKKVIISGYGNAGLNAAILMKSILGVKIIAVGNSRSAVHNENGLNLDCFNKYYQDKGTFSGYPEAEELNKDLLLSVSCDLLVLASVEGVLNIDTAHQVDAKYVLELANGPTTPEADKILEERGIIVIPDLLANSGGVIVSYFEQVQNSQMTTWSRDIVHRKLKEVIIKAFYFVHEVMRSHNTTMRNAALILGITRVYKACRLRGWT